MSDAHADSERPAESEGPAESQPADDVRLGWWLPSEEHDPRALVLQAIAAEKAGFTTSMISDHLQPWVRHQAQSSFVWSVLGAIAHATDAVQMGTGVTAMVSRNDPINIT